MILRDLGADNLADRYESLLEDVSLEEVIAADPDFIFITTMGAEDKALAFMAETFEENPAWAGLSAVKNGDYVMLPKELFHYKPNTRWGRVMPISPRSSIRSLPAKSNSERAAVLALLAAALCAAVLLSLRCGSQNIPVGQLLAALRRGTPTTHRCGFCSTPAFPARWRGAGRLRSGPGGNADSGGAEQRHGQSQRHRRQRGAGFAALLAVTLAPGTVGLMPLASFLGALVTALFIYALAARAGLSRTTLILAGIAVSSMLTAGSNALTLLYPDAVVGATGFMLGGFNGVTLSAVRGAGWYLAAGAALSAFLAADLDVLRLGEESAAGLGLHVGRTRFLAVLAAALLAGAAVSFPAFWGLWDYWCPTWPGGW